MKTQRFRGVLLGLTGLLVTMLNVRASDPVGVYAVVDKVVLEPNGTSPQRIQIWGVFAPWESYGDVYAAPKRGYLYYKIADRSNGKVERAEWTDLKALAGTGQGVAFGQRHQAPGRIRPASEKPTSPDDYVLGSGLTRVGWGGYQDNMKRVIQEIQKAK
jgi:hypothetical protein